MVAVTTGIWSMLKDITMGSTSAGSVAEPSERSTSSTAALTSVPKSNSAKIIDIEFDGAGLRALEVGHVDQGLLDGLGDLGRDGLGAGAGHGR